MSDYLFYEILNRRGNLTRPTVAVDGQALPREASYALAQVGLRLRLRPARVALDSTLLGRFPQVDCVAYVEPGEVRAGDRLAVVEASTALTEAAEAGATAVVVADSLGLAPGMRLHLRDGEALGEVVAAGVVGSTVTLREALSASFSAGTRVETVRSYQVLGAEDEGGEGHHLRLALRAREL